MDLIDGIGSDSDSLPDDVEKESLVDLDMEDLEDILLESQAISDPKMINLLSQ
jgi:hypothetical protein